MRVCRVDPISDVRWQQLTLHPHAGIFHSPAWLLALRDTYGFTPAAYVATDTDDRVVAGVGFCTVDDLCGQRVVCFPFTDVCDPLVVHRDALDVLLAQLQTHGVPLHLRLLRERIPLTDGGFRITKRARWHELDVRRSTAALWSGMASSARRAVRKAERAGVEIRRLEGIDGVRDFLSLHVATRKQKYRLLAQPQLFFESIMHRFHTTGDWHPLGAFLEGRLIAATIYLRWRGRLYYKFNASLPDALSARPNNLLTWHGLQLAQALDCDTLDFGPSDDDQPGLIRFKRAAGAHESELQFVRWTPPEWSDQRETTARRILTEMTALLTAPEISNAVAQRGGEALYRYFA